MNVLLIGSGGREHALAWKIAQSPLVEMIHCAPGNPGIASLEKGACVDIGTMDFDAQKAFIAKNNIGLTVVGPEDPLAAGIADFLGAQGHPVFGPSAAPARLEGSKAFAKDFMARYDIPTAAYAEFTNASDAIAHVRQQGAPIVVKANGLAAGKGVTVALDEQMAIDAINDAMVKRIFGEAGARVIIEECLVGEEASILALCDGTTVLPLATSQDHKPALDGDLGPNTGGMGAYSPAPVVSPELLEEIGRRVLQPVADGMAKEGTPYKGIIYAGLMMTAQGPKVIEFNVRFGDPETQVVLPRMTSDIVPLFLACCHGNLGQCEMDYDDGACVSVVMASGGYPASYPKGLPIAGIAEAEADADVTVFHAGTKLADGHVVTNGGRVLNVTGRDRDIPSAIAKAYNAVGKISFQGAHFRTDIGKKALDRLG